MNRIRESIRSMETVIPDEYAESEGYSLFPQYILDGYRRAYTMMGTLSPLDMTPAEFISHGDAHRVSLLSPDILYALRSILELSSLGSRYPHDTARYFHFLLEKNYSKNIISYPPPPPMPDRHQVIPRTLCFIENGDSLLFIQYSEKK